MIRAILRGPHAFQFAAAAGIALLLIAIVIEARWGTMSQANIDAKSMAAARVTDAGLLPPFSLPAVDQAFPQSAERPIFVPTRRAVPVSMEAGTMRKGQFALVGTSITKEFGDIVLLKEVATNKSHSVRAGQQINGITVDKIEPTRVVLKLADETEELLMKTQVSPKLPPPAAPAPGVAGAPSSGIFSGQTPPSKAQPAPGQAPSTQVTQPAQARRPSRAQQGPATPGAPAPTAQQPAAAQVPYGNATFEEIIARRRAQRSQQAQ